MVHWNQAKIRRLLVTKLLLLMAAALALSARYDNSEALSDSRIPLTVEKRVGIPVAELSGMAIRQEQDGKRTLLAVGDHDAQIAFAPVTDEGIGEPVLEDATSAVLERFSLCSGSRSPSCLQLNKSLSAQWEAVATDGSGKVFLLQETTNSVLTWDPQNRRIDTVLNFDFFPDAAEATHKKQFKRQKAYKSLGEGLLLLRQGHLLVAKESHPAAIYEFGPRGDQALGLDASTQLPADETFDLARFKGAPRVDLVPLAKWTLGGLPANCDLSELTTATLGDAYVLSQRCAGIYHLGSLNKAEAKVTPIQAYSLPKGLKHAEALIVLTPLRFLIGIDKKKTTGNAYLLTAPEKSLLPEATIR